MKNQQFKKHWLNERILLQFVSGKLRCFVLAAFTIFGSSSMAQNNVGGSVSAQQECTPAQQQTLQACLLEKSRAYDECLNRCGDIPGMDNCIMRKNSCLQMCRGRLVCEWACRSTYHQCVMGVQLANPTTVLCRADCGAGWLRGYRECVAPGGNCANLIHETAGVAEDVGKIIKAVPGAGK